METIRIGSEEIIDKLHGSVELRSQNDFELNVEEVEKRGKKIKNTYLVGVVFAYDLSEFDNLQNEIIVTLEKRQVKILRTRFIE